MTLKLDIIDPLYRSGWDDGIRLHDDYSFFHTSAWARVLHDTYGYHPRYFSLFHDACPSLLVPLMEVNSWLTGRRGVSLPFSDTCPHIMSNGNTLEEVFEEIKRYGQKAGWKSIELRGGEFPGITASSSYYGHHLKIESDESKLWASCRDSTQRNIKKARKQGLVIKICQSAEAVKSYYDLHCMTRKKHGRPPQPYRFFEKIYQHVITEGLGFISLATLDGKPVAGAVYFHFGEKALYKFGASDHAYQHLRANNLVMWEAIRWCAERGIRCLDFGRTDLHHDGLRRFKKGWGAEEHMIHYYKYDMAKKSFKQEKPTSYGSHHRILTEMPVPVLRTVGAMLYRHVG